MKLKDIHKMLYGDNVIDIIPENKSVDNTNNLGNIILAEEKRINIQPMLSDKLDEHYDRANTLFKGMIGLGIGYLLMNQTWH